MTKLQTIFSILLSIFLSQPLLADTKDNVELAGDIMVLALPATAYGMNIYKQDTEGALQFTASLATAMATTFILKYSIDAERPNGENNRSFPSGHTSASFTSASFIQMRYGWSYGIPAYAAATFVAWTRVYTDKHYTRDVLAGAAIGVVSSFIFTDAYKKSITITPLVDNNIYGLQLSTAFSSY